MDFEFVSRNWSEEKHISDRSAGQNSCQVYAEDTGRSNGAAINNYVRELHVKDGFCFLQDQWLGIQTNFVYLLVLYGSIRM